jgi:hypothetical protein
VDCIFTDPPFGENIYYADLNYLVESWHGVRTDSGPEARPALRQAQVSSTRPSACRSGWCRKTPIC